MLRLALPTSTRVLAPRFKVLFTTPVHRYTSNKDLGPPNQNIINKPNVQTQNPIHTTPSLFEIYQEKRLAQNPRKQVKNENLATSEAEQKSASNAVIRAIFGNIFVTSIKFTCAVVTGSAAMLAEGFHTLVDSINQGLLYFGMRQAQRAPDSRHQYGYGRVTYFWSLVSAMGMFWVGCGATSWHGIMMIFDPPTLIAYGYITPVVLAISLAVDGAVLLSVIRDIKENKPANMSLIQYAKRIKDPMLMAVLLEDIAACLGVVLASAGIAATVITGNPVFDGIASLCIGALMGGVSYALISMNKQYLTGQAVDSKIILQIQDIIIKRPSVEAIARVQSQWVGPYSFAYKAEIDFDGAYFAKILRQAGYEDQFLQVNEKEKLRELMSIYTEDVTKMVESEVADIESEIRALFPDASFIELEPSSAFSTMKSISAKFAKDDTH
ncbi:zinc transporter [Acrasis kona]|uniref:Zinc transporter n=1 Tax=Acrasis kona TaxID=1008807 RepID=A0AAW2YWX0_9EUKA